MDFKLPDIGEGLIEAQIVRWLVKEGDRVEENQPMVEVLTDKANVEIPSPISGIVSRIYVKEGEIAKVGSVIISFTSDYKETTTDAISEKVSQKETPARVLASPAVRRIAKEKNIDITQIKGTGLEGRILLTDLELAEKTTKSSFQVLPPSSEIQQSAKHTYIPEKEHKTPSDDIEIIPIKGITRAMFDRMAKAQKYSSLFTYVEECDVTELVKLKDSAQEVAQKKGIHLTFLPFILKAVSLSLKMFPKLNATIDEENMALKIRKDCNIGIAMSVDNNLVVPVIKGVDKKNILHLAEELSQLQELAKKGSLTPEHYKDSGFSITSLGKLGGIFATPIVNYPQVSILGIHKISLVPIYIDGKIEPRHMMNLSITSDHRVIEGNYAASFLHEVIKYLYNPKLFLLSLI